MSPGLGSGGLLHGVACVVVRPYECCTFHTMPPWGTAILSWFMTLCHCSVSRLDVGWCTDILSGVMTLCHRCGILFNVYVEVQVWQRCRVGLEPGRDIALDAKKHEIGA